ncbi:MAG: tripartite tricarboxylate transporter substrate binding protein [Burkholderiales bacterium]|nr:tripartite tricarboxylate transporter substrate binding protein [Burkholderiales bacterium]
MNRCVRVLLAGWLLALCGGVLAQAYPSRPIRVILGFPPGGGGEILVRTIGQKLTERWGQPILIDNRPGAASNIAAAELVKSPADGYSLLYMPAALVVNPWLYAKVPYDLAKDFTPVTLLASFPLVLVVHPEVPAKSVAELVSLAKSRPGALNFASIGNASPPHLAGETFKLQSGVSAIHVPYKGGGPAQAALMAGEVQFMFDTAVSAMPHIKSGRTRALAVTTRNRSPIFPGLPSMAEAGLKDFDLDGWAGLVGPAGMPAEIASRLQREIAQILRAPDMAERLTSLGADARGTTPDEFRRFIAAEAAKWKRIVEASGAKID